MYTKYLEKSEPKYGPLKKMANFLEVNIDWLGLGEGQMLIDEEPDTTSAVKTPSNKVNEEKPANHQFAPLLNNDILYSIKQLDNSSVNQLEDIIKHYVESDSDSREAIAQMSLSFRGISDKRAKAAKANDPDKDSRGDTEEG